jgi:hypothetical protein
LLICDFGNFEENVLHVTAELALQSLRCMSPFSQEAMLVRGTVLEVVWELCVQDWFFMAQGQMWNEITEKYIPHSLSPPHGVHISSAMLKNCQ